MIIGSIQLLDEMSNSARGTACLWQNRVASYLVGQHLQARHLAPCVGPYRFSKQDQGYADEQAVAISDYWYDVNPDLVP